MRQAESDRCLQAMPKVGEKATIGVTERSVIDNGTMRAPLLNSTTSLSRRLDA